MPAQKNISTFGDVFKRAYQVVKHNKFLWFFGFFAAFLGAGGEFETIFRNYSSITETSDQIFSLQSFMRAGLLGSFLDSITNYFGSYPLQSFFFLFLLLITFLFLLWLAVTSQIALFSTANKASQNQKVTYSQAFRESHKYVGPVLLINVVAKALLYAVFILVTLPLMSWFILHDNTLAGVLFVILIFFVFIPLAIAVSFIIKYAIAYIVIAGKKAGEAVKLGWQLFIKNWLVSVEMALIVLLIGVGAGVVILITVGLVAIPFVLIAIAALVFNSTVGFTVTAVLASVVFIIIVVFLGSIYVAYQYSAWTLLFQKLVEEKAQSKLIRLLGKIIPAKA